MSKSPKYSRVSSSAQRRLQQERARQQRERAREERRKQRGKEALEKSRGRAERRLEQVSRHRGTLSADDAANPAELRAISSSLGQVGTSIRQATTETAVSAAMRQLDEIDQRLSRAEAEAQQSRQMEAIQRVGQLGKMVAGMEPTARLRFDPAGTAETDRLIGELKALAERGGTAAFSTRADAAVAAVNEHVRTVSEGMTRHADLSRQLTARQADLAGRIADLESDAAAAELTLDDLGLARETAEYIAERLSADDLEDAADLAARLGDRLSALESDLDLAIDRMITRREMLGAIMDALPTLGFAVDPASVIESADGAIGIQATRTGASLAVVVQDNGADEYRVSYLTDASSGQSPGARELSASACGSLIDIAETVNVSIKEANFAVGEVTWDDDRGDRPPRGHGAQWPAQQVQNLERGIGEQ
jgi:hypothetical protein